MGTGFYGSNDPTNSVKALKEDRSKGTQNRNAIQITQYKLTKTNGPPVKLATGCIRRTFLKPTEAHLQTFAFLLSYSSITLFRHVKRNACWALRFVRDCLYKMAKRVQFLFNLAYCDNSFSFYFCFGEFLR